MLATRLVVQLARAESTRDVCMRARPRKDSPTPDNKYGTKFEAPHTLYEAVYPKCQLRQDPATQDSAQRDASAPPNTVYTVRLNTSHLRGSAMDDPHAGVQVCMIGCNGAALLHRIPQIEDVQDSRDIMKGICEVVGPEAGAKCDVTDEWHSKYRARAPALKRRFTEGSVDEVSFVGPDLGPLSGILVGPEQGRWLLEEVSITNSRENITQQFICRDWLGAGSSSGAAYMTALPPGKVQYGSGDKAVLLTTDEANNMKIMGLKEYNELKGRILSTAARLVALGMGVARATGGVDAAGAFAAGGAIGFVNHMLLTASVDRLQLGAEYNGNAIPAPDALGKQALGVNFQNDWVRELLGNGKFRLAVTTGMTLAALWCVQLLDQDLSDKERTASQLTSVLTGLVGFGMYKVAMVAVTLTPPSKTAAEVETRTVENL